MKRVFVSIWAASALAGCDAAAAGDAASKAPPVEAAQDRPTERTRPAPRPLSKGSTNGDAATKLYQEVKRLDAACVEAGGGISGSPDCDAAIAAGQRLEAMGYCIDYPNDEKLARCDDLARRRKEP